VGFNKPKARAIELDTETDMALPLPVSIGTLFCGSAL